MARPPKLRLVVSEAQEFRLLELTRRSGASRALAFRSRIVLACASGMSNSEVASQLKTMGVTVGFWRNRFIKGGVEALGDEPRPGAPRKVTDDTVDAVVRETLESNPRGATHWSTRGMAQKMGLSQSTVSRIGRKHFNSQPTRCSSRKFET